MNRIVLIGNGFDKAHNLPTGYGDFLDYLRDSIGRYENFTYHSRFAGNGRQCEKQHGFYHRVIDNKEDEWIGVKYFPNENKFRLATNPHGQNKSIYFESLFQENEKSDNWSDLESHYFKVLYANKESSQKIAQINSEFEYLKRLLSEYLKNEVEEKVDIEKISTFHSIYDRFKLTQTEFEKTYFITFNYTSKILNQYYFWLRKWQSKKYPLAPIHIHGDLVSPDNPIIFGYGDENSSEYKELELLLNNQLLVNFKTFQYLRSNRYKEVLGLLEESNDIYVQIIGQSCGLCDKALLRAIFQHKNVKSIEATYYKDESKYFENLYNLSRIFDNNIIMRKKIISLSETFKIE